MNEERHVKCGDTIELWLSCFLVRCRSSSVKTALLMKLIKRVFDPCQLVLTVLDILSSACRVFCSGAETYY